MPCGLAICPAWHSASYFTLRPPTQFVVPHTFILFQTVSTFPDASFAWNVLHAYSIWPTPREAWLSAEWSGTLLPAHCASHLSTQSGSCSPLHVQGLTTVGPRRYSVLEEGGKGRMHTLGKWQLSASSGYHRRSRWVPETVSTQRTASQQGHIPFFSFSSNSSGVSGYALKCSAQQHPIVEDRCSGWIHS